MIYYRCPHCNKAYAIEDSLASDIGQQGKCNGAGKGCQKNFIRVETKEKLQPITTFCWGCLTIWHHKEGIMRTRQKCGEHSDGGCGKQYFGIDWWGTLDQKLSISNVALVLSFGLVGSREIKCHRCSSNSEYLGTKEIKDQVVVSNSKGQQEWHNQYWTYYLCGKCYAAWRYFHSERA